MPSTFDMPLDDLFRYRGTNPKPDDFDLFWEAAVAEMQALDPEVEIIPDPDLKTPYAACSHLWFTGVGGARIHAKLLQPLNASESQPAVLMFHGYRGDCGGWHDKLGYAAAGFTVAALDCRGQGGLSEDVGGVKGSTHCGHIIRGLDDAPEKLLYRATFLDAAQLAGIVMGMDGVDERRVGTIGGSQGGALALVCAALEQRVKCVVALHPFLSDYQRVWEMDLAKDAYAELTDFFRRRDPQHERRDEIFRRLGYIDTQHHVEKIKADVLFGATLADTVCPPSSQFAVYNKISGEKKIQLYPDFGHEPPPGFWDDTFRFMMEVL